MWAFLISVIDSLLPRSEIQCVSTQDPAAGVLRLATLVLYHGSWVVDEHSPGLVKELL